MSIHLPDFYLKLIDEILSEKDYPCTSEFIRVAIRNMLKRDYQLLKNPLIEQTSEKIRALVVRQQSQAMQKKIEQFQEKIQESPPEDPNPEKKNLSLCKKQARIDRFWK